MKSLTIAANNLRRFIRDRGNLFFVFIFPMLLILVLGSAFGGSLNPRVGVYAEGSGPLGDDLIARLEANDTVTVVRAAARETMETAVERGELEAAVIVPPGYDGDVRRGTSVQIEFLVRSTTETGNIRGIVESAITQQAVGLRAARFAEAEGVASFDDALAAAGQMAEELAPVTVEVTEAGEAFSLDTLGQFDSSAQTQLLLFMFVTSLTGATALIQTRRLGVARRMISTPTPVRDVLTGEGLGRLGVALIQGLFILVGTWLIFGVDWGNPLLAILILVIFAFVGSGAAVLMGALFDNDQQAGGMGVLFGLGLAALGGSMVPLQVFELISPMLYRVAHITPHAWALEAFDSITIDGGGLVDILGFLGVLIAYALVLYVLAIWRLRAVLTR